MRTVSLIFLAVFALLLSPLGAAVNFMNGTAVTTASTILGKTPNSAVMGQTLASAGGTPTVTSATVNAAGTAMTMNLSESCTTGAGGNGGVTVSPSGGASTATYSSGSGSSAYVYGLSRTILMGETLTRSYTQPGNGIEATVGGIDLASFTTQAVTNNSTAGTSVATDAFTRADSGTLGSNWTDAVPGWGIVSNQASATTAAIAVAFYNAVTPAANSRTTITLRTAPSANFSVLVYARFTSGGNGYAVTLTDTTLAIQRFDTFAATELTNATLSFTTGDTLGFSAFGSTLQCWKNGVSVLSTTDATYSAAQPSQIGVVANVGTPTFACDDFLLENF